MSWKLSELFEALMSVVYPPRCHVCGRPLPYSRRYICTGCMADLPLASYSIDRNPLSEALLSMRGGDVGIAFMRYEPHNGTSKLVQDFKYRGYSRLARYLGRMAAERLRHTGIFDSVDLLLPIPLHPTKRSDRGYNQAQEIAKGISDVTGIPVGNQLVALRPHTTQTRLSHTERQSNVDNVYGVCRVEELEGRTILIIDDVFTTGATLMSAGREVARNCRGVRVRLFALASAHH